MNRTSFKTAAEGGQAHFAPKTAQNEPDPGSFEAGSKLRPFILMLIAGVLTGIAGCKDPASRSPHRGKGGFIVESRNNTAQVLVNSISHTLNHLVDEVVTDLHPPQPVLDASKSANRQEVLAVLDVTPGVPDSPYNYLSVPEGNANFRTLQVRPGDIVRYYIRYNEEDLEHGYENISYIELAVRRLDANNPQNALIIEDGLSGPVEIPHRIEIWRFSDKRMNEIRVRLTRYVQKPRVTVGWEPTPDESGLVQLGERLNQWWRNLTEPASDWVLEPLLEDLPTNIRESELVGPLITPTALADGSFEPWDSRLLQQAVWLRDISAWARKDALTDVDVAGQLFDWTVRNIQLDMPENAVTIHEPWQALMYGHGTAEHRAWVFAELCRQQQLDVVMLATLNDAGKPQFWLPALLSDGELYLFDTRLGLPIPGEAPGSVATLAEVIAKPGLLGALNIDGADAYPVTANQISEDGEPKITAWLVASPLQLSRRAAELQQVLEGENYVVVAADARRVAGRLNDIFPISEIALWPQAFEALINESKLNPQERLLAAQQFLVFAQRPLLWKARVLHFQGTKEIPPGERNDPLAAPDLGHKKATALYQDPLVRPSERTLAELSPDKQALYGMSKADASYWLGLLSYDVGKYDVAAEWLQKRTLDAFPNGPWTAGAQYNLARTFEARGDVAAAIELLESSIGSPQRHGNLLRAKVLSESPHADQ